MAQYKCLVCGYEFDEPSVHYERHGFDYGMSERWSVCPNCGEAGYTDKWDEEEDEERFTGRQV